MSKNPDEIELLAKQIRKHTLVMTNKSRASHIGACLSIADILAVLYAEILRVDPQNPDWVKRDRFILSKGHAAAALYAVLAMKGYFPVEWLDSYCIDNGKLPGHVTKSGIPGVEVSTGSLGHGLPVACGMAVAGKGDQLDYKVYALMGDGECNEGSVWESALFAAQYNLDNLVVIIDYNKLQGLGNVNEVLNLDPFTSKWESFNWVVKEIDGHDYDQLKEVLHNIPVQENRPTCIIAHTTKGKGISFMENQLAWHYKSPNDADLSRALKELGMSG